MAARLQASTRRCGQRASHIYTHQTHHIKTPDHKNLAPGIAQLQRKGAAWGSGHALVAAAAATKGRVHRQLRAAAEQLALPPNFNAATRILGRRQRLLKQKKAAGEQERTVEEREGRGGRRPCDLKTERAQKNKTRPSRHRCRRGCVESGVGCEWSGEWSRV